MVTQVRELGFSVARRTLPDPLRRWLWARWRGYPYSPPPGRVRFGNLRRVTPFSRDHGYDRGQPIDRYYIEHFMAANRVDVQGDVLEIADDNYTRQFGDGRVNQSHVLHAVPGNPKATIVGDLTCADHILSNSFDCVILTQTLQLIYDVPAALQTVCRILKPGGVLLATLPAISPLNRYDMERWGYYWGFTSLSARRLFEEVFEPAQVQVTAYGNVLAATAFLYGMATRELKRAELDHFDPDYEVIISVRAEKPGMASYRRSR